MEAKELNCTVKYCNVMYFTAILIDADILAIFPIQYGTVILYTNSHKLSGLKEKYNVFDICYTVLWSYHSSYHFITTDGRLYHDRPACHVKLILTIIKHVCV